jgi:hypothetical protein
MTPLRVCKACSRHVLVTEQSCPFCSAALGPAPQRALGKQLRRGMSRAQILAVAAAVTSPMLGACSETITPDDDGNAGASGNGGSSAAGGSGVGGSGAGGTSVSGGGGGSSGMTGGAAGVAGTLDGSGGEINVPEYGGSFPLDSGLDEDGGVDEIGIAIYSAPNPRE